MFDMDDIRKNISMIPSRTEDALMAFGKTAAADLQGIAQRERPWTDRTAHARQRLKGYCEKTESGIRIYLAHGVNYGVHLEFGHEKRYAVIYPTLRREAPGVMKACRKLIGG